MSKSLTSGLKEVVPAKGVMRAIKAGVLDLLDARERRQNMIPPRRMNFVGAGDFKSVGQEFRKLFVEYGGLAPNARVLDVGCGIGRMAIPLTGYLSRDGEYHGIDIVQAGVEWCQQNVTTRFPNFHFLHSDVKNKFYNPRGIHQASSYRFPFDNRSFDFVYLTSVFTHMFPADLENYMEEIGRVLKKGGRSFITFFLMNEESHRLVREKRSTQSFVHEIGGCYTTTPDNPEGAIAYPEDYVRKLFEKVGISIEEPIHYGSWCGRPRFLSYQDIVIGSSR